MKIHTYINLPQQIKWISLIYDVTEKHGYVNIVTDTENLVRTVSNLTKSGLIQDIQDIQANFSKSGFIQDIQDIQAL